MAVRAVRVFAASLADFLSAVPSLGELSFLKRPAVRTACARDPAVRTACAGVALAGGSGDSSMAEQLRANSTAT